MSCEKNPVADCDEIQRAIGLIFKSGDVVEVRIPKTRAGVISGYFTDRSVMARAIAYADKKYHPCGVYYVLNKINPALLGRAYNRLKEYAEYTTADGDIVSRKWLPIDLDPVRPAGISASEQEHAAALDRARAIAKDMRQDWGCPIIGDSGNGAHLLYQIDLQNDREALVFVT